MKRLAVFLAIAACGGTSTGGGGGPKTVFFDLDGPVSDQATFWNLPFPSDLRLDANGAPDITGYPNARDVDLLKALLSVVPDRRGFPVMPVAYFRFTSDIDPKAITDVIPANDASVVLVDIDPNSPEKGTEYPMVAQTFAADDYAASGLVAIAPRPGIVLRAHTIYAYVIRTAFAPGFAAPDSFTSLASGTQPEGLRGEAAASIYQPLWPVLIEKNIPASDVLVATVFTTGDEVSRVRARSEAIRASTHVTVDGLHVVNDDTYVGFCRLDGTVTMPQFQQGTQPFDTQGTFVVDANDVPQKQGDMTIPVTITLPKAAMPAAGWPLFQFFHGSGGLSSGIVDLGPSPTSDDIPTPGEGPGFVVAKHGIAAASSALPLNPERLPGATDYEYININNLAAFPYTFQQGVIEQRLLTDALLNVQIDPATVTACTGLSAPSGQMHHFDSTKLVAGGQSMGGMYTNMIGAVEDRFGALVPTGAGGYWNLMILETATIPGARQLLTSALGVNDATFSFVHPALAPMALGWEIAEPVASMARLGRRPLDGFPVRHVYEPVGMGDTYFPIDVYDAAALSYGNQEAGDAVWPSMQGALALDHLDGLITYPVKGNRDGKTRMVVQYMGDGIVDAHYIYRQLDAVKHQYGCFLESYLRDGVPTVPAPGGIDDPCP